MQLYYQLIKIGRMKQIFVEDVWTCFQICSQHYCAVHCLNFRIVRDLLRSLRIQRKLNSSFDEEFRFPHYINNKKNSIHSTIIYD